MNTYKTCHDLIGLYTVRTLHRKTHTKVRHYMVVKLFSLTSVRVEFRNSGFTSGRSTTGRVYFRLKIMSLIRRTDVENNFFKLKTITVYKKRIEKAARITFTVAKRI
jgi:hypothetical protein